MPFGKKDMRKTSQSGFTVIEILFAFALLTAGIVEVMYMLGQGQYASAVTSKNIVALTLAKQEMERIKESASTVAGFDTLLSYTPTYFPPYGEYSGQVTVANVGPGQIIKDVVVTVSYTAPAQAAVTAVSLETRLARYQ